ncbi:MAG: radical SAM protein [Chloroflexota bacterium]|jgi:predicted DNA-binding helix-hairpin-helix protein
MDSVQKLELFATQMHLEPAEDADARMIPLPLASEPRTAPPKTLPCGQIAGPQASLQRSTTGLQAKRKSLGITEAVMPGGKRITLLKTMLTSACERNCNYCPFRAGRNYRRATFEPEELARIFMDMYRAGLVEGMFLSSGIIRGGVSTQDKLISAAEILRHKLKFRGYLHLKIMPGTERDQVRRAMQLASRVSVNLEGPNDKRLALLAPKKIFLQELLQPLKWVEEIRQTESPAATWNGRWPSSTTQFVVGAVGDSDLELLTTSGYLLRQLRLSRTYYMAFNPVPDTPLEDVSPENPWRQHRLYQASFLLRDYGFDLEELPFTQEGNLPLDADPKMAWAQHNLAEDPVELNRAEPDALLRVPGIGPKGARSIIAARRHNKIRELNDLKTIGVSPTRPAPYVLLDGKRPPFQPRLL